MRLKNKKKDEEWIIKKKKNQFAIYSPLTFNLTLFLFIFTTLGKKPVVLWLKHFTKWLTQRYKSCDNAKVTWFVDEQTRFLTVYPIFNFTIIDVGTTTKRQFG